MIRLKEFGIGIIISIYFALKPLYLNSSGTMQICDIFLMLALTYLVFRFKGKLIFPRESGTVVKFMITLVLYQIFINFSWAVVLEDFDFIIKSSYYIFNLLVFYLCLLVSNKIGVDRLKEAVLDGAFYSMLVTVFGLVFNSGMRLRSIAFFNNPNQLGYYAIVVVTVVVLWSEGYNRYKKYFMLFGALWAVVCSGSKAAFIAMAFLVYYWSVFDQKKVTLAVLLKQIIPFVICGLVFYFFMYSDSEFVTTNNEVMFMRNRILNMASESDSDLGSGRAYNRIFEMGYNWLWGMGEGSYYRFITMPGYEIHSTYANILVSYGLLGTLGYLVAFKLLVLSGKNKKRNLMLLSGVLLYFVTHNGIRNTLFWIILAVMYLDSIEITNGNSEFANRRRRNII